MIYQFTWKERTERVKMEIICSEVNQGRLRAPICKNMIEAAQFMWIKRYFQSEKHVWKAIFKALLTASYVNLDLLLYSNYNVRDIAGNVPLFYKQVLRVWNTISNSHAVPKVQYIWYNSEVRMDNKPVQCKDLAQAGLHYVNDLWDTGGNLQLFRYWQDKGVPTQLFLDWAGLVAAPTDLNLKQIVRAT